MLILARCLQISQVSLASNAVRSNRSSFCMHVMSLKDLIYMRDIALPSSKGYGRIGQLLLVAVFGIIAACANNDFRTAESIQEQFEQTPNAISSDRLPDRSDDLGMARGGADTQNRDILTETQSFPIPPIRSGSRRQPQDAAAGAPSPGTSIVDAKARELPLPDLVDIVFGQLLDVPYFTGPGIAAKRDVIVNLRSSGEMPSEAFLELVRDVLTTYGVSVVAEDGVYKILDDSSLRARMPRFIRGRASSDTPAALRPLVMFVELEAMNANEMNSILKQAFPGNDRLKISANPQFNVITLNGLPDDVNAALAIIEELDELSYAGTQLESYRPRFMVAADLANQLSTMLSAEGWQSSANASVERTILSIPVEFSNQLFVFSKSSAAMARVRFWLQQLDQPSTAGDVPQIFVYSVQNVDARLLSDTVNAVLTGTSNSARSSADNAFSNNAPGVAAPAVGQRRTLDGIPGSLVVDPISNRLIYSGTASDFARLRPLLEQLDRAPGEVLILVTIAEVTLTDETRYGLDFFVDSLGTQDVNINVGTGGIGVGSDGIRIGILSGNVDVALNAFASNNQVNVLSKPKLVARSGGAARLQVGTDVPVITSQRAASAQDGVGETDILQQVEYRKTGVLLTIEPIIFSQNRVDLTISQEVSTVLPNSGSEIASPTISNRTLDTQLSVQDGETVILGGLIQNTTTENETGVPILKDIPLAGNLFKNSSIDQTRTELLVLITAYILRDRDEKEQLTESLLRQLEATSGRDDNFDTLIRRPPSEAETAVGE